MSLRMRYFFFFFSYLSDSPPPPPFLYGFFFLFFYSSLPAEKKKTAFMFFFFRRVEVPSLPWCRSANMYFTATCSFACSCMCSHFSFFFSFTCHIHGGLEKKKVALFCFFIYYFLVNSRFYQLLSRFSVKDSTGSAVCFCVFPFFPAQSLSPCNGKSPHVWRVVPYAVETPKPCFFFTFFFSH